MYFLVTAALETQLSGIKVASRLKFRVNQYYISGQLGSEWPLTQRALPKGYLTNNITAYPISTNLILLRAKNTKSLSQFLKFQKVKCRTCGINQMSFLNVIYQYSILAGIPWGNFEKNLKIAATGAKKTRSLCLFVPQMLKKSWNFAQQDEKSSQGSPDPSQSPPDGRERSCLPFSNGARPHTASLHEGGLFT